MPNSSLLPFCSALLLALALASVGSAWVNALYAKAGDILSFPREMEQRARHRQLWLACLGAVCGFRLAAFLSPDGLPWGFLAAFFLLLITCTDFEQ